MLHAHQLQLVTAPSEQQFWKNADHLRGTSSPYISLRQPNHLLIDAFQCYPLPVLLFVKIILVIYVADILLTCYQQNIAQLTLTTYCSLDIIQQSFIINLMVCFTQMLCMLVRNNLILKYSFEKASKWPSSEHQRTLSS